MDLSFFHALVDCDVVERSCDSIEPDPAVTRKQIEIARETTTGVVKVRSDRRKFPKAVSFIDCENSPKTAAKRGENIISVLRRLPFVPHRRAAVRARMFRLVRFFCSADIAAADRCLAEDWLRVCEVVVRRRFGVFETGSDARSEWLSGGVKSARDGSERYSKEARQNCQADGYTYQRNAVPMRGLNEQLLLRGVKANAPGS